MSAPLISIIGPPAAGKTTLARLLAERLPAKLILEDYAGNPFLAASFQGRADLALPAQLYFLFSRVAQLSILSWPKDGLAVSDYGFCQDGVFAACSLTGGDLQTYLRLAEQARGQVKPPELVIHLDGAEQVLLERIARRGREFETTFTPQFLADMRGRYAQVAAGLDCRVLTIDTGRRDLLAETQQADLLREIQELFT